MHLHILQTPLQFECKLRSGQQACNLDVNVNPNANKAINWRRGSGKSAGNFPAAMEEVGPHATLQFQRVEIQP